MTTEILTIDGRDYYPVGYGNIVRDGFFLTGEGQVKQATESRAYSQERFLIVKPVPMRHTFGKLVFEETGEERMPVAGEWWLTDTGKPTYAKDHEISHPRFTVRILTPVEVLP